MEKAIRVLVANRPRLLREVLVTTLEDQPWIKVVGEASEHDNLSDLVDQSSPDLLIIALDDPARRPPICDALLQTHPNLWIIAVAPDKNCSMRYWASFEIHSDDVESSEEGFLRVVRRLADGIGRTSRVS